MKWDYNVVVAIDFDNTITNKKGQIKKVAKWTYHKLKSYGCILVLWTARTTKRLNEAEDMLNKEDMVFDYFNEYPLRECDKKINCDIYIDDRSTFGFIPWVLYICQAKILTRRRWKNGT